MRARSLPYRLNASALLLAVLFCAAAHADVPVYSDSLAVGWQDWSWGGVTRDFSHSSPVHSGTAAISVTYSGGWSGLQLGVLQDLDVTSYDTFRFFVHGGSSGGQQVQVDLGNSASGAVVTLDLSPAAGTWTQIDVPLWSLGSPRTINYVYWFNNTAGAQPVFYVDDVAFVSSGVPTPTPLPPGIGPLLSVDAAAGRHPIDPDIYGMNFADESLAAELRLPVRRWGGNATTRYNWQNDTSNHASDWYFENLPNDNANPAALPDGSSTDQFVEQDRRTGTTTLLTVPLIGWTPKQRAFACGFSVRKYGAQQSTDPYNSDCGNGISTSGNAIAGNDPLDTSTAITPPFVQAWLSHLTAKYGTAAAGGVRFYDLDNEPELWDDTHRDVHPTPTSYDELRDRGYAYAAAIKAMDPGALTLGPVGWGWTAYFWSALDWSAGGSWWNNPQDRLAHGDVPFVEWYLQQMHAYEQAHGLRILDYLDLHYYPQAAGVSLSPAGSASTQALRLRSTRSLWDTSYVDESWIGDAVQLIPRMRQWVGSDYPDTKLAISEYNWGALDHLNGALAQADVLGIFGREGLDLATLWSPPSAAQPGAFAFRMFRNYDGAGGTFGDVGVQAFSTDQDQLAVYAAQRSSDGALTLICINKATTPLTSQVTLNNAGAGVAQVYRYSASRLDAIVRDADQTVTASGFSATFPPSSITLMVLPNGGAAPSATAVPSSTPTRTSTVTAIASPTATRTPTTTRSATATATRTSTNTATATRTSTATASATRSPTRSPSSTASPTRTPTPLPTMTATAASSPTRSNTPPPAQTPTPTATKRHGIGGHLHALNGTAIPGASVQLLGASALTLSTDASGQYVAGGLPDANWRIVPQKSGDPGDAISALDAVYVLQAAVGQRSLTPEQQLACDVSGNGTLSSLDAALILQYRVGLLSQFPVAQQCGSDWVFEPQPASAANQQITAAQIGGGACIAASIDLSGLSGDVANQDFVGMLFGDCTGNWQPGAVPLARAAQPSPDGVRVGRAHRVHGVARVPLAITTPFSAAELAIAYSGPHTHFRRLQTGVQLAGSAVAVNARAAGRLYIAIAAAQPVSQAQLWLEFDGHPTAVTARPTLLE